MRLGQQMSRAVLAVVWATGSQGAADGRSFVVRPGTEAEQRFLFEDQARVLSDIPGEGSYRNADGGMHWIYRFDVAEAQAARLTLRMGNNFLVWCSPNGETWTEVLREREWTSGLSNIGEYTIDLAPFLGGAFAYVKVEHSAPDQENGGFGPCVFGTRLEVQDQRDLPLAAVARAPLPPVIDGHLSDECWSFAPPIATFSDRFGEGVAKEKTVFRLLYDETSIYIGARCYDDRMADVISMTTTHDSAVYTDNCIEVFLQPPEAGEQYYHLALNTLGTTFDELCGVGPEAWEPNIERQTRSSDECWEAELAVRLSDLGHPVIGPATRWRAGLYRVALPSGQMQNWSCVEGGGWHSPQRFGILQFTDQTAQARLPGGRTVNIATEAPPTLGGNELLVSVEGQTPPGSVLRVDVLPADETPPSSQLLPVEGPWAGSVAYCIESFGRGYITATLCDGETAVAYSRAVLPYHLEKVDVFPFVVQLGQPYYSTEKVASATVEVNLRPEQVLGARVVAQLRLGAELLHETTAEVKEAGTLRVELPVDDLDEGTYALHYALRLADGTVVAEQERSLTKLPEDVSPRIVTFDERHVCYLDGEPFFPLGFMLADPRRENSEAGYNVSVLGLDPNDESQEVLNRALANGQLVIGHICQYLRHVDDLDRIRETVSRFKDHPALFGWYTADEPEAYNDTPAELEQAYRIVKEIDPYHPVIVLTNAPGMFPFYANAADVVMADPYPIPGHPISLVSEWTEAARRGLNDTKPVWMTPQGFGWKELGGEHGDPPTDEEFRNMLYQALIHGAKGIIWWPWSVPFHNHWEAFRQMGAECNALREVLLLGEPVPGMPPDAAVQDGIHYRAWLHEGQITIVAANVEREPRRLELNGPFADEAEVLFEDRRLRVQEGRLSDEFESIAVHVYRTRMSP